MPDHPLLNIAEPRQLLELILRVKPDAVDVAFEVHSFTCVTTLIACENSPGLLCRWNMSSDCRWSLLPSILM
jgi:hypothetical protein